MAANAGLSFINSFMAARNDVKQGKRDDAAYEQQQSELAHAQQRRGITEQRQDTEWQQGQDDRTKQQSDLAKTEAAHREQVLQQAESEGLFSAVRAAKAGMDGRSIEQNFNSPGSKWKIKPGTWNYDEKTDMLDFTAEGGKQFHGPAAAILGMYRPKDQKTVELNSGSELRTPDGELLARNDKTEPPKYEQFDPTKDVYEIRNGKRVLVSKGVPKAGEGDASGKWTPTTRLSYQKAAADRVESHFKQTYNPELKAMTFGNPDNSDRARAGAAFANQGIDATNGEAGPDEIGDAAIDAAKLIMSSTEADTAAKAELKASGRQAVGNEKWIATRAKQLESDARVRAGQTFQDRMEILKGDLESRKNKATSSGKQPAQGEDRKTLNGKKYVKMDGKWYEEN